MAIVSAYTIIRSISLFHITLAVLFLKNPKLIADQNVVFILGEAMQLPIPREFNKPSATTAFIGLLFAFLGLSDLTALSLSDGVAEIYWGTQTPVRLAFFFAVTGYTYMFKEGGMFASKGRQYNFNAGDDLKNSIVFTWGFLEMATWFWVFVTLRDERRQRATRLIEKRKSLEEHLNLKIAANMAIKGKWFQSDLASSEAALALAAPSAPYQRYTSFINFGSNNDVDTTPAPAMAFFTQNAPLPPTGLYMQSAPAPPMSLSVPNLSAPPAGPSIQPTPQHHMDSDFQRIAASTGGPLMGAGQGLQPAPLPNPMPHRPLLKYPPRPPLYPQRSRRPEPGEFLHRLAFIAGNPTKKEREMYNKWRAERLMETPKAVDADKILKDPEYKGIDAQMIEAQLEEWRNSLDEREQNIPILFPEEAAQREQYEILHYDRVKFEQIARQQAALMRGVETELDLDQPDLQTMMNEGPDEPEGVEEPEEAEEPEEPEKPEEAEGAEGAVSQEQQSHATEVDSLSPLSKKTTGSADAEKESCTNRAPTG